MRLENFAIKNYRSIESIKIDFPKNKPLILFGPNNVGKTNILSAFDRFLGERYPTYTDMKDSDFFKRDKENYPNATFIATFSEPYYGEDKQIKLVLSKEPTECVFLSDYGRKVRIRNEDRKKCLAYTIDAVRNINNEFNYSSRYSLLSKFSHHIHAAISSDDKKTLSKAFEEIKKSFRENEKFKLFFEDFKNSLKESVRGFVHSLEVDFSAYDPNNYAKSMKIYASEGGETRGFEEFGTGEQQILLMAFAKSYMKTFKGENFILIIEEPEAHLHPLAIKWLKQYIEEMCKDGMQIIISTHSSDFLDMSYLDGLVRVYKKDGITRVKQLSVDDLCSFCIDTGVDKELVSTESICDYYKIRLYKEQLNGLFAEIVFLVEGATEYYAIPEYLKKLNFYLPQHGIEIINCMGKNNIPLLWRLFKAFDYQCFILFDGDSKSEANSKTFKGIIEKDSQEWKTDAIDFEHTEEYAYFGRDFESHFKAIYHSDYEKAEEKIQRDYGIKGKPSIAKAIAQRVKTVPSFIEDLRYRLDNMYRLS